MLLSLCSWGLAEAYKEYTATAQGYGGEVSVTLTLDGNRIYAVEVKGDSETQGIGSNAIDALPQAMVDSNSVVVDTFSGATFTSKAILEAAAAALAQAGLTNDDLEKAEPTETAVVHEDMTCDILVLGGGGTGLVAAVSAIENGADPARVVVVEKTGVFGGTSATAGAVLTGPLTRFMKSQGYTYSEEQWVDDWMANVAHYVEIVGVDPGYPEKARVEAYLAGICPALDWLEDLGFVKWTYYRSMPGTDFVIPEAIVQEDGSQLFVGGYTITDPMVEYLKAAGADLRLNTAGTELVVEDGKVVGAVVTDANGSYTIRADTGVVLATGGYSRDEELLSQYSPAYVNWISFDTASVADTGDGIKMARDIGAAMYENGAIISVGTSSPNRVAGNFANFMSVAQRLLVNSHAERFVNEGADYYEVSLRIDEQPDNGTAWAVLADNTEGVDVLDAQVDGETVVSADSLEALAEAMHVSPEALATTVARYNEDCAAGNDTVMGKMLTPEMAVQGNKYYAFKVGVCMAGTIGGVKTDADFHVLDTEGKIIEGLWAGGCVSNRSIMGYTYMHSAGFGYAIVSGRTIGERIMSK